MRVFIVVGRAGSAIKLLSLAFNAAKADRNRCASASSPTTPIGVAVAPSATKFDTTLPAPPSASVCRSTSTTGTGASGEIRRTLPQMNSSSITSPKTTMRLPANASVIDLARSLVSVLVIEPKCYLFTSRCRSAKSAVIGFHSLFQDFLDGGNYVSRWDLTNRQTLSLSRQP